MFAFRLATPDDAEQIAKIVYDTSEGVVAHLFDKLIPGMKGTTILSAAFMKGEGPYSTRNVIVSEREQKITSLLFLYPAAGHAIPGLMQSLLPKKRLDPVRPILERAVPDSLYINTIWLDATLRGHHMGDALMLEATERCRQLGHSKISLFCWNDNAHAMHFYTRHGFTVHEHMAHETLALEGHTLGGSILLKHIEL